MVTADQVRRAGAAIAAAGADACGAAAGCYRLLGGGVLVGPAGGALYERLADRHRAVRKAVGDAAFRADEVGRALAPPVRVSEPALPGPAGAPSWKAGTVQGDPEGINALCGALKRAGHAWMDAGREISRHLAVLGAPSGVGQRISRAGADLLAELPDLNRRRDLLLRPDPSQAAWTKTADALMKALMTDDRALYTSLVSQGLHPMDIPRSDPSAAASWWRSLTPRQQSLYTRAFPAVIGWTDGLPATARDKANRHALTTRLTHLQSQPPDSLTPFDHRDLTRLQSLAAQISRLENSGQDVKLLGIDSTTPGPWDVNSGGTWITRNIPGVVRDAAPGPDGRLVLAVGNPDLAENVAVYVPGTTAQLDSIGGDIDRVANLYRRSEKYGSGSVATIMWLGYDAPDTIIKDASMDKYAERGAPDLLSFLNGLEVDQDKHVTALGHSYGSVVIGEGANQGDLRADEIIAVGSPGMHVGQAKDLDVGEDHVWIQKAEGDPVPALGRFVHGSSAGVGIPTLPLVPSDDGFGGTILSTDTHGHSDYWKAESVSLDNQAKVIMGGHETREVGDDPELAPRPMLYR